jgi:hypothetical protein
MTKVERRRLYHIHTHLESEQPFFEEGKKYTVFARSNHFWSFYETWHPQITLPSGRKCGPAKFAYYCVKDQSIDLQGLAAVANQMKEVGMLLRELIFEDVRAKSFADLPSRMNSIWLSEADDIEYWTGWLKRPGIRIRTYEVDCCGRFHRGGQQYLDSDIDGYSAIVENATRYWRGDDPTGNGRFEILFHGEMTVLNSVGPLHLGQCTP